MKMIQGDELKCVLHWKAIVGESPVWSEREQRLYWVDINEKKIFRFDPGRETNETFDLPEIVPCIAVRSMGGLVLTLKKRFAFYDPYLNKLEYGPEVESDLKSNRFNDGKCDPRGRLWAGTMNAENWVEPSGSLYRFDTDHEVHTLQKNVICANGMGWSPDEKTMYFTESFRYEISAYDYDADSGELSNRRGFIKINPSTGSFPDGLTVDAKGYVWCCAVGVGQIQRYDPKGALDLIVQLPVPRATGCTFGGKDLKTLYITTSTETLTVEQLEEAPLSGSIFALKVDVPGLPANLYTG